MAQLKRLTVRGYKSIEVLDEFELGSLNVLIGANGAGKSNFISLFRMLGALVNGQLQLYIQEQDGPDALMHRGRRHTPEMQAEFDFSDGSYSFELRAAREKLVFAREGVSVTGGPLARTQSIGSGHTETRLRTSVENIFYSFILRALESWRVFHFHDTSDQAAVRNAQPLRDNLSLKADAGNLAPFLRRLQQEYPSHFKQITETVRLVAPFFGDFVYRERQGDRIPLEWTPTSDRHTPYGPRQLSDGTLRFIALATLLLQPAQLQPDTIIIDEPELGLHPYALNVLAALLKRAAESQQLIVATQSVELVNALAPEQVIVVNQREGASHFSRLLPEELADWLQDYTLGELWKMNVLGGRPGS